MNSASSFEWPASNGGFVPVVHGATGRRPDDELDAAVAVAGALEVLGFTTEIIVVASNFASIEALPTRQPLLVFNLIDTINGDGRLAPIVPARLDALLIPYTGCKSNVLFETLSKVAVKLKLAHAGLPTPDWSEDGTGIEPDARVIVKPIWEHGSLGIDPASVVRGADATKAIRERTLRWNTEHFAEAYIDGREFAAAMVEAPQGVEMLPIREILFAGFADGDPLITDYDAKWTPGSPAYVGTTRRFGIEKDEPALAAELRRLALACWQLFRLSGYARVDFRLDASGAPFILEINVNPHLGPDSGFVASAAEAGLSYHQVISRIVEASRIGGRESVSSPHVSLQE